MARWGPDARGRLEQAALDLYGERGFEQTTVAEIAARAGLTERTFFRHFADKREVLFGRSHALRDLLVNALAETPASSPPIDAVAAALLAAGAVFTRERHDYSRRRQAVIDRNPDLQERELIKLATLASWLAETLRGRGVPEPAARLTAETGMAVFRVAFERWVDKSNRQEWTDIVRDSLRELKVLVA